MEMGELTNDGDEWVDHTNLKNICKYTMNKVQMSEIIRTWRFLPPSLCLLEFSFSSWKGAWPFLTLVEQPCLLCSSYNKDTGIFTVPPGGDGLYYLSTYLVLLTGKQANFDMTINAQKLCTAAGDATNGDVSESPGASCSGMARLAEGQCQLHWDTCEQKIIKFFECGC